MSLGLVLSLMAEDFGPGAGSSGYDENWCNII